MNVEFVLLINDSRLVSVHVNRVHVWLLWRNLYGMCHRLVCLVKKNVSHL